MFQISKLYKVDGEVVFYTTSPVTIKTDSVCLDIFGDELSIKEAKQEKAIATSIISPRNSVERIYRNIILSNAIISIVRAELADEEDQNTYLAKLQPAINLALVGMFKDASIYILSLIPDDVISEEQLIRWSDLLTSSNSVLYSDEDE